MTSTDATIRYHGLDADRLARWRATGVDDGGHPLEPFTDDEGDWPLRCCLRDSEPGDRLTIVAASPFPWDSPFAGRGPVVIHAEPCAGPDGSYPPQFDGRQQVLRAYGTDGGREHALIYDLNRLVRAGEGIEASIAEMLADERVEFVHSHNLLAGCYSFTARLSARPEAVV